MIAAKNAPGNTPMIKPACQIIPSVILGTTFDSGCPRKSATHATKASKAPENPRYSP